MFISLVSFKAFFFLRCLRKLTVKIHLVKSLVNDAFSLADTNCLAKCKLFNLKGFFFLLRLVVNTANSNKLKNNSSARIINHRFNSHSPASCFQILSARHKKLLGRRAFDGKLNYLLKNKKKGKLSNLYPNILRGDIKNWISLNNNSLSSIFQAPTSNEILFAIAILLYESVALECEWKSTWKWKLARAQAALASVAKHEKHERLKKRDMRNIKVCCEIK